MSVMIDVRRRHPRAPIEEIAISWRSKTPDEFRASIKERNRSKVGRMARLKGMAEEVATPTPTLGELPAEHAGPA